MKDHDGIHIIKQKLAHVPTKPGVYRMLGAGGAVLYVGKAKNLKKRLTNYTQPERMSGRIRRMVFETVDLVVVQTTSEVEALLLEVNLIKSLKPRYNVLFRDDSSYPSILITHEEAPRVMAHRGAKKQKGDYFGPYPNARAVHASVDVLERVFQLRTCTPSIFKNRTRPCLKFDIKRCSGPCVGKISASDYAARVAEAKLFLKGNLLVVQKRAQERMQKFAEKEQFEAAAEERNRLQALSKVASNATGLTHGLKNADVFAVALAGGKACVQGFFYRGGQHVGNQTFRPTGVADATASEVMAQFLMQHYVGRTPPRNILCLPAPAEAEIVQGALAEGRGNVRLLSPSRGEKRKILLQAEKNAEQTLHRQLAEQQNWQAQMANFAKILGTQKPLKRVECFDISNISGKNPVASMVVAGEEGMLKQAYRKFNVKTKDTPDDYAMMREVLLRRYKRVFKTEQEADAPDVVMVDGGKGHLNVLLQVFDELNVPADVRPVLCSIAKGEERDKGLERIFLENQAEPLPIAFNTPLIFVLQRIRDEAHRFAIGFHRQKRSQSIEKSALDGVPGVGAKRKKALLLHFGSPAAVKAAGVEELAKVEGVSHAVAQTIYDWFQK